MLTRTDERPFIIPCPVPKPDNCFALFYFVINACISHVVITLIRYFLISKSRDLVSYNPGISGLINSAGSRYPEIRDPAIAIPMYSGVILIYLITTRRVPGYSISYGIRVTNYPITAAYWGITQDTAVEFQRRQYTQHQATASPLILH